MKKFLLKFLFFGVFFFTILMSQKVLDFFTPWYWGYAPLRVKLEFIEKKIDDYDVMFIGSSITFRSSRPQMFDSLTHLKSFNLGVPDLCSPESYTVVEHLLSKRTTQKPQVYIVELDNVHDLSRDGKSLRNIYWMNSANMSYGFRYFMEKDDYNTAAKYLRNYIMNQTKFGIAKQQFESIYAKEEYDYMLGLQGDGFLTFTDQMNLGIMEREIKARQERFINDSSLFINNREKMMEEELKSKALNQPVYLERITSIIKKAEDKNIRLIFVRSPVKTGVNTLFDQLPEENKLDMGSPVKFPDLYDISNFFDHNHLSDKGSKYYTIALVEQLKDQGFL